MKDQLTRIKQLFNYNFDGTFITEEMQVSDDFKNNKFYIEKEIKSVTLEIGYDPENTMEHKIFLILSFSEGHLAFAFSILDKNGQYVKGKESIYSREEVNKFLPKELQKSIVFFSKLKEMFKLLMTMEKPNIFFMETYEDYTEEKQLLPYNSIIDIILQNGYVMESKGLSHDKKKYHWKFVQKTKQQIKESKESDEWYKNFKKDDKYWERRKELTMEAVRRCLLQKEKEKNNKTII